MEDILDAPIDLSTDFSIPSNKNEIAVATDNIEKLKFFIEKLSDNNLINDDMHEYYFDEVIKSLDYVGSLSLPAFNAISDIEFHYTMKYLPYPNLAKKLYLDHYSIIHQPYNILKNRCFRLLDMLDEIYIKKFNANPPNFNKSYLL